MNQIVAPVKRVDMKHLHEMNNIKFCEMIKGSGDYLDAHITMKLDGFMLRFGKDADGLFFMQTARSPVLRRSDEILWFALMRDYRGEALERAHKFAHLFEVLKNSDFIANLPKDTAITCECFMKDLAEYNEVSHTYRYVTIPYDAEMMQAPYIMYVYDVYSAREPETKKYAEVGADENIEFRTPFLQWTDPCGLFIGDYHEAISGLSKDDLFSLTTRTHAWRERKRKVSDFLQDIKGDMAKRILDEKTTTEETRGMGRFFEGIVLHINNEQYKVITPEYTLMRVQGAYS